MFDHICHQIGSDKVNKKLLNRLAMTLMHGTIADWNPKHYITRDNLYQILGQLADKETTISTIIEMLHLSKHKIYGKNPCPQSMSMIFSVS